MYIDVKQLRYGHLMIMTDQDHDGSHIKGLIMNYFHTFYPSLMRLPGFLIEFITPVIKVSTVPAGSQLLLCCADYIYGNIYGMLQLDSNLFWHVQQDSGFNNVMDCIAHVE